MRSIVVQDVTLKRTPQSHNERLFLIVVASNEIKIEIEIISRKLIIRVAGWMG